MAWACSEGRASWQPSWEEVEEGGLKFLRYLRLQEWMRLLRLETKDGYTEKPWARGGRAFYDAIILYKHKLKSNARTFFSMLQSHWVLPTFFKYLAHPERKFQYSWSTFLRPGVLHRVTAAYANWSIAIRWSPKRPHFKCLLKTSLAIFTHPPSCMISCNNSNKTIILSVWEEIQRIIPGVKLTTPSTSCVISRRLPWPQFSHL